MPDRSGRIYLATCTVTGKGYVGQTLKSIPKRWAQHVHRARTTNFSYALYRAIRKYGPQAFTFQELQSGLLGQPSLDAAECEWIARLNTLAPNGYNIRSGGSRGPHSEATKAKMRASALARMTPEALLRLQQRERLALERASSLSQPHTVSGEQRARIASALKGRTLSPEHRAKARAGLLGHPVSEATRAKISQSNRGRVFTPEHIARLKAARTGRSVPLATRAKMAASHRARWADPETYSRIAHAGKGLRRSEQARANMSIAQRARWGITPD